MGAEIEPNAEAEQTSSLSFILEQTKAPYTEPFRRFLTEYLELVSLFAAFVQMAKKIDNHKGLTRKLYDTVMQSLNPNGQYRYSETYKSIEEHGGQFSRNMTVGMANNFFSYVSEVLQVVLVSRPEILRSSERLTTEEILQFADLRDIIAYVADRKINELSYGGLKGLEGYLKERLGVDLFERDDERSLLTILAELRNIFTHNRGVVNRLFLARVGRASYGGYDFRLGEQHELNLNSFDLLAHNAILVASRLDQRLAEKFKLPTNPLEEDDD